jgi:hypothetical protein
VRSSSSATAGGHGVAALLKLSCSAGRALGELCAGGGFRTPSVKSPYTHTGVGEMMKEASRDCVSQDGKSLAKRSVWGNMAKQHPHRARHRVRVKIDATVSCNRAVDHNGMGSICFENRHDASACAAAHDLHTQRQSEIAYAVAAH